VAKNGVIILGLAGAGLAAIALTRRGSEGASPGYAGSPTSPGQGAPGFSFFDPMTGFPIAPGGSGTSPFTDPDHFIGPPIDSTPGYTPTFSPDFERTILHQNEEANRLIVGEQRKQTQSTNLGTAIVAAGTAAVAVPAIYRAAQGLIRTPPQAVVRPAAPTATAVRPIAASAGLGLALGTIVVAGLDKTGVLDRVQDYGQSQGQKATGTQASIVKTIALPLSVPGAVITSLAGRGSIAGNVRQAFQGTFRW
jgi:hypothetical protein